MTGLQCAHFARADYVQMTQAFVSGEAMQAAQRAGKEGMGAQSDMFQQPGNPVGAHDGRCAFIAMRKSQAVVALPRASGEIEADFLRDDSADCRAVQVRFRLAAQAFGDFEAASGRSHRTKVQAQLVVCRYGFPLAGLIMKVHEFFHQTPLFQRL